MRRIVFGVGLFACLYATPAHADNTTCATAAEQGQRERAQGKLLDARRNFLVCSATNCPSVVAKDCTTWASEVLAATPTIVIDAKDAAGTDVGDATLSIDGSVIAHQLDGAAIPINPGSHTLDVVANTPPRGGKVAPHVTQALIAKEGEKLRSVRIVVPAPADSPAVASVSDRSSARNVGPWIVVGVGAAVIVGGMLVHLTQSYPANCNPDEENGITADTGRCGPRTDLTQGGTRTPTQSELDRQGQEIAVDRETAGKVRTAKAIGTALIIGGSAVALGGLLWYFLDRPKPSAMIAPWFDVGSGGVVLRSSF